MNIKHSRGPPLWDFPQWVYDLVEWSVMVVMVGFILWGVVTTMEATIDLVSNLPPNRGGSSFSFVVLDRDNRPELTRVLL